MSGQVEQAAPSAPGTVRCATRNAVHRSRSTQHMNDSWPGPRWIRRHASVSLNAITSLFSVMMMCWACRRYVPPPTYEELNSGTLEPAPFADLFGDAENIFGQVGLT